MNGNVQINEQERRKGRKTGDRDGLRVQEDLFLSSCELLTTLPLSRSVNRPRGRRAQENISDEESLCAFAPLRLCVKKELLRLRRAVSLWLIFSHRLFSNTVIIHAEHASVKG